MSEWIAISDQSPQKTGSYLTYGSHSYWPMQVSTWFSDCEAWEHEWLRKKKSDIKPKTWITHWMPLPEPPTT